MGKLFVVATPIGNLSDISYRAIDILKSVKYIAAEDTRRTIVLLNHYDIKTAILISYHKFNEINKSQQIIDKIITEDCDIALVSDAGTPSISDPGSILVECAHTNNIEVVGIPGACAITDALSICGFDIKSFTFLGFFPRQKSEKENFILSITQSQVTTFVIYESPLRIISTIKFIKSSGLDAEIAICNDLTKKFELFFKGSIDEVLHKLESNDKSNRGEYVLIINKNQQVKAVIEENNHCLEAILVETMIKNNISIKQAINKIAEDTKINKKEIYQASLRLKELIKDSR